MEEEVGGVSKTVAVAASTGMTLFYVATLYAPTVIFRIPPPQSFKEFMIRRFVCAAVSTLASIAACALILPLSSWKVSNLLGVYGIRGDHKWQAVVFPIALTSLVYAGSFALKFLLWVDSLKDSVQSGECSSIGYFGYVLKSFINRIHSKVSSIMFWRNLVVAPLTEELVFRACMIPLFLCGRFEKYTVIILCPVFFSLAHLNHLMVVYSQQNHNLLKASMIIGLQLGYTVVFGSYASFLFVRTGHLLSPLVAHVFCNYMGLPVLFSQRKGIASLAFVGGAVGFVKLFFPLTRPGLYNDGTNNCKCWQGFCSWN